MTVIKNPSKLLTKAKCFYFFPPGALHAYFCTTREAEPTNWWARNSLYRMCSSDYVGDSFLLKRIYSKSTVMCLCMNGRCLCRPEQMNTCRDRCERRLYAAHVRSGEGVCLVDLLKNVARAVNPTIESVFFECPATTFKFSHRNTSLQFAKGHGAEKKKGDDN